MNKEEMIKFLQEQLDKSQQQNKELLFKIDKIQTQLDKLLRQLYGRKSEKSSKENNNKNDNNDSSHNSKNSTNNNSNLKSTVSPESPSKAKRKKPPEHLIRETIYHDLPDEQKFCVTCNKTKSLIGTQISEQLEFIPAKLFVKEHVKYTYSCNCCINTVSMPEQPILGGLAGPGLLSDIIISKYDDRQCCVNLQIC